MPTFPFEPDGWRCCGGRVTDDGPRWVENDRRPSIAFFKHARPLRRGDAVLMRVEGGDALVGLAGAAYDPGAHDLASVALLDLNDGTTHIGRGLSQDGREHSREAAFGARLAPPFDLALRVDDAGVPQAQFEDDGLWHDFVPQTRVRAEGQAGGPAGGQADGPAPPRGPAPPDEPGPHQEGPPAPPKRPAPGGPAPEEAWFLFLALDDTDRLDLLRVVRPKPTKSAEAKRLCTRFD